MIWGKITSKNDACIHFHVTFFLLFPNMAAKVVELEDNIREVYQHSKDNRKETGRLEGISLMSLLRQLKSTSRHTQTIVTALKTEMHLSGG